MLKRYKYDGNHKNADGTYGKMTDEYELVSKEDFMEMHSDKLPPDRLKIVYDLIHYIQSSFDICNEDDIESLLHNINFLPGPHSKGYLELEGDDSYF